MNWKLRVALFALLAASILGQGHHGRGHRSGDHGDSDDDHHKGGRDKPHMWECIHEVFRFVSTACSAIRADAEKSGKPVPDVVSCLLDHQSLFGAECTTVVAHVVDGLTQCKNDTQRWCPDSTWGMRHTYETPMECLRDHRDVLSETCSESKFIHTCDRHGRYRQFGGLFGKWDNMNERHHGGKKGKCMFWFLAVATTLIGLLWAIKERRRRRAARRERWAATGLTPQQTGTWTTGLFGSWTRCMPDWRTCLPSCIPCWLPLQVALNSAEVRDRDAHGCDVACSLHGAAKMANVWRTRQEIRAKYDFPEAQCEDCLAVTCCAPCTVAQHTRELDARAGVGQGETAAVAVAMPAMPQPVAMEMEASVPVALYADVQKTVQ